MNLSHMLMQSSCALCAAVAGISRISFVSFLLLLFFWRLTSFSPLASGTRRRRVNRLINTSNSKITFTCCSTSANWRLITGFGSRRLQLFKI